MSRPLGSKNKLTKELRTTIQTLLENNYNKFELELNQLTGKPYLDIYIRLIDYILPKPKEQDEDFNQQELPKVIINYTTASDEIKPINTFQATL
jgi:hypothetical protein